MHHPNHMLRIAAVRPEDCLSSSATSDDDGKKKVATTMTMTIITTLVKTTIAIHRDCRRVRLSRSQTATLARLCACHAWNVLKWLL